MWMINKSILRSPGDSRKERLNSHEKLENSKRFMFYVFIETNVPDIVLIVKFVAFHTLPKAGASLF